MPFVSFLLCLVSSCPAVQGCSYLWILFIVKLSVNTACFPGWAHCVLQRPACFGHPYRCGFCISDVTYFVYLAGDITPVPKLLHWLLISFRAHFKKLVLCFRAVYDFGAHASDGLCPRTNPVPVPVLKPLSHHLSTSVPVPCGMGCRKKREGLHPPEKVAKPVFGKDFHRGWVVIGSRRANCCPFDLVGFFSLLHSWNDCQWSWGCMHNRTEIF